MLKAGGGSLLCELCMIWSKIITSAWGMEQQSQALDSGRGGWTRPIVRRSHCWNLDSLGVVGPGRRLSTQPLLNVFTWCSQLEAALCWSLQLLGTLP